MGQQQSGVKEVEKVSGEGSAPDLGLTWGYCCRKGWKPTMEDEHFALASLPGEGWGCTAAFSVLDGHGGKEVADFCKRRLPHLIAQNDSNSPEDSLKEAIMKMDDIIEGIVEEDEEAGGLKDKAQNCGSTCLVALVGADLIYTANVGDSQAVLSSDGEAIPLSEAHKPESTKERARIEEAGGSVTAWGPAKEDGQVCYRIDKKLAMSRSIGDLRYKSNPTLVVDQQMVVSTPTMATHVRVHDEDEFILLATDGLWDVLTHQQAVDAVRERIPRCVKHGRPLSWALEEILAKCIAPTLWEGRNAGGDNMTAVLVMFEGAAARIAATMPDVPEMEPIPEKSEASAPGQAQEADRGCCSFSRS